MLVHNGKLKIQEEFAQKEKDLEIQQRVLVLIIHNLTQIR